MEGERWGLGNEKGRGHLSGKCDNRECSTGIKKNRKAREKMVEGAKSEEERLAGESCGGKQREVAGKKGLWMYTPLGQRGGRDAEKCDKVKA